MRNWILMVMNIVASVWNYFDGSMWWSGAACSIAVWCLVDLIRGER